MPVADRLAEGGLSYTRFHTTAVCSPTRAALLTGRNHHSVGMGGLVNWPAGAPGYTARMPRTAAPLARMLTCNGYATARSASAHETPLAEISPLGPFDRWPTVGGGFERFYGFIGGGECNQYYPPLFDGTTRVAQPRVPQEDTTSPRT